jgi:6-phosphogluconate dehydrogenase
MAQRAILAILMRGTAMADKTEFGIVGLGKIGSGLAHQALEKGFRVVGFDKKPPRDTLIKAGLVQVESLAAFRKELPRPWIVFLYVPAGPVVDSVIDELVSEVGPEGIIVDGGNSYWGDSIRRAQELEKQGIHLVDLGTSGGVEGARHGACFMAGGAREAVERVEPILKQLAVPGGYVYAGPSGAGHFVKLVHNGIEFGMLQAIGEGIDLLEHYHDNLDIAAVLGCWRHGSVIRSWLIELMHEGYRDHKGLDQIEPYVEDTGEVNWLVADALRMEVPISVIAQAVMKLFISRDDRENWSRAIALMRHGFGGHPFGADEAIAQERQTGRVGPIFQDDETVRR